MICVVMSLESASVMDPGYTLITGDWGQTLKNFKFFD